MEGTGGTIEVDNRVMPIVSWTIRGDAKTFADTIVPGLPRTHASKDVSIELDFAKQISGNVADVVLRSTKNLRGLGVTRRGILMVHGISLVPSDARSIAFTKRLFRRLKRKPRLVMLNRRKRI